MSSRAIESQKSQIERQPLAYYLQLSYPVTLYSDPEEEGYVAEIKDLPGCLTQGETLEETMQNIAEARELWIETTYEAGREIPLPTVESDENSSMSLTLPKALQQDLTIAAKQKGISTAQYIVSFLEELRSKGFVATDS
jgi:antitoxin HicB